MSTLQERLLMLEQEHPHISRADLARAAGVKQPSVSDWFSGKTKSLKAAPATCLAQVYGVSPAWLATGRGSRDASYPVAGLPNIDSGFAIPQWDTGGKMSASGLVLRDQPGVIRAWHVSDEWLRQNVHRITSPANLAIVTGFGPSMRPLYNPGDPLLLDTGRKRVDVDGIYFFRVGEEGFIKQLQRIPTARGTMLRAKSYNPDYDPFEITPDMDFEVFGWIVKVWRGEDF